MWWAMCVERDVVVRDISVLIDSVNVSDLRTVCNSVYWPLSLSDHHPIYNVIVIYTAGMTAEGDNRVLYQKVAKELLSRLQKGKVECRVWNVMFPVASYSTSFPLIFWQNVTWNFQHFAFSISLERSVKVRSTGTVRYRFKNRYLPNWGRYL